MSELRSQVPAILAQLFDRAPMGYLALDESGCVLEINAAAAALLGGTRQAWLGRSLLEHVDAAQRNALRRYLADTCAQAGTASWAHHVLDLPSRPMGGAARRLELHSQPYPGMVGRWCVTVLVDATAEVQAESARRESERMQQAVLDALSAQIAVVDTSGRIVAVNESWRRFARANGGSPKLESGIGLDYLQACRDGLSDDNEQLAERALEGLDAVLSGKRSEFVMEYPCHSAQQQRWFMMTATPLGPARRGAVIAHVDISERVRMEQESRARREEVAHAARLSSVTVLAGSLVHELSQPLAAANLFGESLAALARRDLLDRPRLLSVADDLREQVARAVGILNGLRRFMRRGELATERSELEERVRQAMGLVGPLARRKRIRVGLTTTKPSILVKVNSLQIEQVMVNLLCNGIEAIDRGNCERRQIDIHIEEVANEALITVVDTGPGFTSDWLSRMFDVFETEKENGMGMGLAVSRTIIEAHGGRLWAESGSPSGAVLRFTLPLCPAGDNG